MRIPIVTGKEPLIFTFKLAGNCPDCVIRVYDAVRPYADFTSRIGNLTGEETFVVRMPVVGENIIADIYQDKTDPNVENPNLKLVSKNLLDLETFPTEYNSGDPLVKEALAFINDFSLKAGYLGAGPEGSVYLSDGGRFRIDYMDYIIDRQKLIPNPQNPSKPLPNPNLGKRLGTPARISTDRGVIEVSKNYFQMIPVSQRAPILMHEVSHFYFNNDQDNEKEADFHAAKMALGSGFSDGDVYAAFVNIFKNAPTQENKDRQAELLQFISEFGAKNYKTL